VRAFDVRKRGGEQAIINLGAAFRSFFKKRARYPWFKKKGGQGSFCAAIQPGKPRMDGQRIALPIAGTFFLNAAGLTPGHGTFH
jgi:putative transposase